MTPRWYQGTLVYSWILVVLLAKQDKHAHLTTLFNAAKAGDEQCYREFLHNILPILRAVTAKKLPQDDRNDVIQEILISIHKARHTFDGNRPVMPWLMAIAHFRISDHFRKAYRRGDYKTVNIDRVAEPIDSVTILPFANEPFHELIKYASERDKRILTLMHVEGYTAKETAAQLGMKESAVKVAAHRAIKKIRQRQDV